MSAPAIPFVREMAFAYGVAEQLTPRIARLVSHNPGPFTFHGTGVYLIGAGEHIAVIDPGPMIPGQIEALTRAIGARRVSHILVTHDHMDHSPAARPLAQITGAPVYGLPGRAHAPATQISDASLPALDEDHEADFRPDVVVDDGQIIAGDGWTLEAIATPGHASTHVCYALAEENALFCGDHVMGWSTTVVVPPDGDMDAYLSSLDKVAARGFDTLWPTHGPPIAAPAPFLAAYRAHRLHREEQILAALTAGPQTIAQMVPAMYAAVDPRLHPAAAQSVLAHLIRLVGQGRAACDGAPTLASVYRLG